MGRLARDLWLATSGQQIEQARLVGKTKRYILACANYLISLKNILVAVAAWMVTGQL
jgi:hypothetical protein